MFVNVRFLLPVLEGYHRKLQINVSFNDVKVELSLFDFYQTLKDQSKVFTKFNAFLMSKHLCQA